MKRQPTVKEIQEILYSILIDINNYCSENHIHYMLSGGTCLGAVREHGFIPWDDDADIMFFREDFNGFLAGFAEKYKEKYFVSAICTDPLWARPVAKIWDINTMSHQKRTRERDTGIGVDICPIDEIPANKYQQKIWYARLKIANHFRNSARRTDFNGFEKFRTIKKCIDKYTAIKGLRYYAEKLDNLMMKYNGQNTGLVGCVSGIHYWEKEIIAKEDFSQSVLFRFVDEDFPVPIGYDRYLTNLYGDYMTPKAELEGHSDLEIITIKDKEESEESK